MTITAPDQTLAASAPASSVAELGLRESATFDRATIADIQRAAATGVYDIRGWGAKRRVPHFDDLLFLGASVDSTVPLFTEDIPVPLPGEFTGNVHNLELALPFPLLSDFNHDVGAAYGVLYEEYFGLRGVARRAKSRSSRGSATFQCGAGRPPSSWCLRAGTTGSPSGSRAAGTRTRRRPR